MTSVTKSIIRAFVESMHVLNCKPLRPVLPDRIIRNYQYHSSKSVFKYVGSMRRGVPWRLGGKIWCHHPPMQINERRIMFWIASKRKNTTAKHHYRFASWVCHRENLNLGSRSKTQHAYSCQPYNMAGYLLQDASKQQPHPTFPIYTENPCISMDVSHHWAV